MVKPCASVDQMPSAQRRFPPPWTVEDIGGSFVVKASNDRPLVFIYYWDGVGRRSLAKLLTRNAARRIAAGIAKLPELLRKA
jgi:anti-sigma factor ChrR (cupin superfamily)